MFVIVTVSFKICSYVFVFPTHKISYASP